LVFRLGGNGTVFPANLGHRSRIGRLSGPPIAVPVNCLSMSATMGVGSGGIDLDGPGCLRHWVRRGTFLYRVVLCL